MNTEENPQQEPVPDIEELPVRRDDETSEVPPPKRVTRETEAAQEKSDREDLAHGDEGVDDPPPESDQMGD